MINSDVSVSPLDPTRPSGPLLLQPVRPLRDARDWVLSHRDSLKAALQQNAGLVLRGFGVDGAGGFEAIVTPFVDEWMGYQDRASKRSALAGRVMTSTDTPPAFTIEQHCESAFTARWPRHIFFHCELPAESGGRTPVTEIRGVTRALDARLRDRFEREGVLYLRTFGDGLGMDWRDVFQVDDREVLARYCEAARIDFEWLGDGRLRTWQVRPAFARHPVTGEQLWFNHALALHASSLDPKLRAGILRQSGADGLPHDTYFGSGAPIDDEVISQIRRLHLEHTVRFYWQGGDVLLLDNMLAAHGREPYVGDRRVTTLMANPWSWEDCGATLGLPAQRPVLATAGSAGANAAPDPNASNAAVAARTTRTAGQLETWLLRAVALELQLAEVRPGDNLHDLGGDSLVAVNLAEALYGEYGIDVPIELFLQAETLSDVVAKIDVSAAA